MTGEEFPAVIPGGLDVAIGAFEEGDVLAVPGKITVLPELFGFEQLLGVGQAGLALVLGAQE